MISEEVCPLMACFTNTINPAINILLDIYVHCVNMSSRITARSGITVKQISHFLNFVYNNRLFYENVLLRLSAEEYERPHSSLANSLLSTILRIINH